MRSYCEILRVTIPDRDAGLPVHLKLQQVYDDPPDTPGSYYCLSWRTPWPSGLANRRIYHTRQDGFWRIPVSVALDLLDRAELHGMLDEQYDDPLVRFGTPDIVIIDSRNLDRKAYEAERQSIIHDSLDHDWGAAPVFVIVGFAEWRKIMIVDAERAICTFRSTTTDDSYPSQMKLTGGLTPPWQLDRSMQDASSAMMRRFRQTLLEL